MSDPERERARVEVEHELVTFGAIVRARDNMVMRALSTGLVSKHRMHVLTGISRPTIDRIIERWQPPPPGAPPSAAAMAGYLRGFCAVLAGTSCTNLQRESNDPYNPEDDEPFRLIP